MDLSQENTLFLPSAVERTPIELWRMILLIAVESPLLPRIDDDILDGITLFSSGCHSQMRHRIIEALRGRLRLVCRGWDEILEDVGAHMLFISTGMSRFPLRFEENRKTRRIENVHYCSPFGSDCVPKYVSPLVYQINPLPIFEHIQWTEHLQLSLNIPTDDSTQLTLNIIERLPRLRSLELNTGHVEEVSLGILLKHPNLTGITHLSIGVLGIGYGEQGMGPASFPAVRYLCIQVDGDTRQEHVLEWSFPSLVSFHLRRDRSASHEGQPFRGLEQFLASHSRQITSLNIEYGFSGTRFRSLPYPIDEPFWRMFPNLRLFGPGICVLDSEVAPPPTTVQLELLAIRGFQARIEDYDYFRLDPYIDRLILTCQMFRVNRIAMLSSWDDMASGFAREQMGYGICLSSSAWSERFFQEAVAKGIRIVDVDRVPITDPEGQRFLKILRNPPNRE